MCHHTRFAYEYRRCYTVDVLMLCQTRQQNMRGRQCSNDIVALLTSSTTAAAVDESEQVVLGVWIGGWWTVHAWWRRLSVREKTTSYMSIIVVYAPTGARAIKVPSVVLSKFVVRTGFSESMNSCSAPNVSQFFVLKTRCASAKREPFFSLFQRK